MLTDRLAREKSNGILIVNFDVFDVEEDRGQVAVPESTARAGAADHAVQENR